MYREDVDGEPDGRHRTIGERVDSLRQALGKTMEDLAYEAGVSLRSVYEIKTGKREPRLSTIRAIAKALGVSPQYLLYGENLLEGLTVEQAALKSTRSSTEGSRLTSLSPSTRSAISGTSQPTR